VLSIVYIKHKKKKKKKQQQLIHQHGKKDIFPLGGVVKKSE
jgi:hypothetical protein